MGKHSGRYFKYKLLEMGFNLKNNEIEHAFHLFKKLADPKKLYSISSQRAYKIYK